MYFAFSNFEWKKKNGKLTATKTKLSADFSGLTIPHTVTFGWDDVFLWSKCAFYFQNDEFFFVCYRIIIGLWFFGSMCKFCLSFSQFVFSFSMFLFLFCDTLNDKNNMLCSLKQMIKIAERNDDTVCLPFSHFFFIRAHYSYFFTHHLAAFIYFS